MNKRVLAVWVAAAWLPAQAEQVFELPDVAVTAPAAVTAPLAEEPQAADTSSFVNLEPAGAVRQNGQLTGIAGIRGQFGDRVRVLVDGMEITPACPNHMDPPLHYIEPAEVAELEVRPATATVALSGDSTGGTIIARRMPLAIGGPGGVGVSGLVGQWQRRADVEAHTGNEDMSVRLRGGWAEGDDYDSPLGTVRDTGYSRRSGALEFAGKGEDWRLDGRLGRMETRDAGTPALGMDMVKDDADQFSLRLAGQAHFGQWTLSAWHHDIDHLMDNYSLRPAGTMRMQAPSTSRDNGLKADFEVPRGDDLWRFGLDVHNNDFDAYQMAASGAPMSRRDMFNGSSRQRVGFYGEWTRQLADGPALRAGLRYDQVDMSTGQIQRIGMAATEAMKAMLQQDARRFNGADLNPTDHNWDGVLAATWKQPGVSYELSFARKTRSPGILERFGWTPLAASAGLADGRQYVGDPGLKPEVSHGVTASAEWQRGNWTVAPAIYYQRVSDYIQGMAGRYMGNPMVLTWSNAGTAELWGFDGGVQWQEAPWRVTGTLGYVRGRMDGDNLYRLPPLRLRLAGDYTLADWTLGAEWLAAARATDVADYNGETESAGWGILNLRARYALGGGELTLGVDNLFDKLYADHLSGVNRVMQSAVPVGDRLPGAGRNVWLAFSMDW